MRNFSIRLFAVFFILAFTGCQQNAKIKVTPDALANEVSANISTDNIPSKDIKITTITDLEIPKIAPGDIVISHTGYSLLFNKKYMLANWVAYELTKQETKKIVGRSNKFIPDPEVKIGTSEDKDYSGSGYDKGHLAPAADMGWSSNTMAESFYYSNMSPQLPGFNRGIWKKLEELVRTWAIVNDTIYVVTGPVLTTGLKTIGPDKISVPDYFYKVILDYTQPDVKGIGFIISNASSGLPLQNFAVTIDSVEKFTGIDFFPLMTDDQENLTEKTLCVKCWTWKNTKTENKINDVKKSSTSIQCKGLTKSGRRCKKKTSNASGYCNLHESQKRVAQLTILRDQIVLISPSLF